MPKRGAILLAVVLAMLVKPLQLPAASCILSNVPEQRGCKPNCCANRGCCALSKKNAKPPAPPLAKAGGENPQQLLAFDLVLTADPIFLPKSPQTTPEAVPVRPYAPPLLATTCIRLI
jgi:hypothetical protein